MHARWHHVQQLTCSKAAGGCRSRLECPLLTPALSTLQALPEEAVERCRAKLASCSSLPLLTARAAADATWPAVPSGGWAAAGLPPHRVLVGCGAEDAIVDGPAVEEVCALSGC